MYLQDACRSSCVQNGVVGKKATLGMKFEPRKLGTQLLRIRKRIKQGAPSNVILRREVNVVTQEKVVDVEVYAADSRAFQPGCDGNLLFHTNQISVAPPAAHAPTQ